MNKTIVSALFLAAGTLLSHAATITWTGAAGDGSFETAGNWSEDAVPGMGSTVVIGNGDQVVQSSRTDWWGMNVTITNGSTLTCNDSVTKWQSTTITIDDGGALIIKDNGNDMTINNGGPDVVLNCFSANGLRIEDHVKITNPDTVPHTSMNFGLNGSMYVNEIWNNDWRVSVSMQLDNGSSIVSATGYKLVTREFFTLDHNTNPGGGAVNNLIISSSTVTDTADQAMTLASSVDELTLDESGMGKYLLSRNDSNGSWSVMYVAAIPEPSAFGLLAGIGALALVSARRRRAKA